MSYEIKDRLSLKILFGEDEFPFARTNSLEFLHMSSSTRIGVPMLHLALQDNIDFLAESKHMGDGARIQIVMAPRGDRSNTYVFRLNSSKRTPNAGGHRYEMDAYIDASTYWHASSPEIIKGTSHYTLSRIAATCGLGFSGDPTADDQIWIPRNLRYHEWARQIAERGFRSDSSCMQLGLNFDKTLTYKDLSSNHPRTQVFNFGAYKAGSLLLTDVVPMVNSGTMNHFSGYSEVLVEQDLEHPGIFKQNSKVQVSKSPDERSLMVNSKIKKAAENSRVVFSPIDCGNGNSQFERALYQNRRLNNLYSSQLSVLTPEMTSVKLLDKVTVTLDKTTEYLKAYSGEYHVASRIIRVQGNEYYEKLELLRKSSGISLTNSL